MSKHMNHLSINQEAVWISDNVLVSINVFALRRDWLVLG